MKKITALAALIAAASLHAQNSGVGTTQPRAKLDVIGGVRAQKGTPDNVDASNRGYAFDSDGDTGIFAVGGNEAEKSDIVIYSDNKPILTVGGNTNYNRVGVGTTTPKARLDVAGNVKITDGTEGDGKILTSDATGTATWQTPAIPEPSPVIKFTWDANGTADQTEPDAYRTYGPFTVIKSGWYSMGSRWFYSQNTGTGGSADKGAGYVWLQINTDSSNTMDGSGLAYEYRAAVNTGKYSISPPSGSLIYLKGNTNYYIHQWTDNTKYASTGERNFTFNFVQ